MSTRLTPYAGWAAYLSAVAAILGLVSLLLFFGLEAPHATANSGQGFHFWGPVSDICPIVQMLALLVVARTLYLMERPGAPGLTLFGSAIWIVGVLGVSLLQLLLIFKVMPFDQEVGPVLVATAAVGVWLILVNHLGQRQKNLPSLVAWLGIAAGAAFVLEPVIFSALGGAVAWQIIMSNYLLLIGSALVFLVSYVGFPVWAIWLGRVIASANRESTSASRAQVSAYGK